MEQVTNVHRKKFVKHIYNRMKEIATGACFDRVYWDKPQQRFFVGTLCTPDNTGSSSGIRTKVAPVRMGVEFLLKKTEAKNAVIKILPKAALFYKVFPTYIEQLETTLKKNRISKEELIAKIEEQSNMKKEGIEIISYGAAPKLVFKKIKIEEKILSCKLSDFMNKEYEGLYSFEDVKNLSKNALDVASSDPNLYKAKKRKVDEIKSVVPLSQLADEKTFDEYVKSWGEKDSIPSWEFIIGVKTTDFDDKHVKVSAIFENTCAAKDNDNVDNFIFDTFLEVEVTGAPIQNFILEYLNDHYRYDGQIAASGINCEAIRKDNKIITEHMPSFEQPRIKTREDLQLKFKDLSTDNAIAELNKIAISMKEYLKEYKKQEELLRLSEIGKGKFKEDVLVFENEINRFEIGISMLQKYPLALKSFKKMNETFYNAGRSPASDKSYDSWRVFQIIFIVMNIPDIISTEYKEVESNFERVEVLCFPTGGGKTETYLGLVVFTLFFDRFRGKTAGVSAIIKFPLRLLSLQQIQRIANILAQAELIRRKEKDINADNIDSFSLGYFVGDINTPNELIKNASMFGGQDKNVLTPIIEDRNRILKNQIDMNDESLTSRQYLIISRCPFCGSKKIMIDADEQRIRLIHRCMEDKCKEIIPVYISDIEIYRYLPSFIIATLDKVAICGWQKNFRNIFGQVIKKCPLHGYTNSEECTERWSCTADKSKFETVKLYDPVPTMQIQDEMHLVRESLGTFNSHYESFLEELTRSLTNGRRSMKILTATATVSEYKFQTDHLYCKDAEKFPSLGHSLNSSFYASADESDLNRIVIGVTPHNKTLIFTMLAILQTYHELIQTYSQNPTMLNEEMLNEGIKLGLTEDQLKSMLEDYKIKLSYHLAKNDGDAISNSIRTMTNRSLRDIGVKEIVQRPLTGDVSFNDVRVVLDKIENPKTDDDKIDLIVATSMISHGVDLNKLNFMVFMGMPTNTAEYIQASSRVGRAAPGIVIAVFNATRERDQSYYKFFTKFHEFRDLLIEAVPINRWAKFSIKKTLPGIFTASVMNYFDTLSMPKLRKSINMSKMFASAITQNLIKEDDIKKFILKSYKTKKYVLGFEFDEVINEKTDMYIHEITQALGNTFIAKAISDQPMTSLRDVDVPVDINISAEGALLLGKFRSSRTVTYYDDEEEDDLRGAQQ